MAYRGKFANVACGLSTAGHHIRLVGPVGSDSMGDQLVAELEQCGVDIEYSFRAGAASPRTLILLDETGERTIIAVNSEAGPSSFLPVRGPDLRSADCVYIEGYTRYPAGTAAAAKSAFLVTSPPVPGATTWPATVVVGSQTQYAHTTSAGMFEAVRSVSGKRRERVVVTRGRQGADAYASSGECTLTPLPPADARICYAFELRSSVIPWLQTARHGGNIAVLGNLPAAFGGSKSG